MMHSFDRNCWEVATGKWKCAKYAQNRVRLTGFGIRVSRKLTDVDVSVISPSERQTGQMALMLMLQE
jgi:hypothetical protein